MHHSEPSAPKQNPRQHHHEGVYHAFSDLISRSGMDVQLAPVGCFGACYQEPLVNVRLPGSPLLVLRRVQINDVARILHDLQSGHVTPDLVYCKVEEWDHITSNLKYGHGYPEAPAWNEMPLFQGAKQDRSAQLRLYQSGR